MRWISSLHAASAPRRFVKWNIFFAFGPPEPGGKNRVRVPDNGLPPQMTMSAPLGDVYHVKDPTFVQVFFITPRGDRL
jgi:hypothetical protein